MLGAVKSKATGSNPSRLNLATTANEPVLDIDLNAKGLPAEVKSITKVDESSCAEPSEAILEPM